MGLLLQCCDSFYRDWIKSWEKTWEILETVCLQQIFHLASLGLCRYAQHQKYVFKSCDTFGCMPCNKSLKLNLVWIFERITLVKWVTCSWKQHNQMNYYFFLWEYSLVTRQRDSRLTYLHNISFQRPVLVILDRNMDLCTPLHHTWTYQALVHDVLVSHNIILLWTVSALIRFTPKWLESNFSKQYHHQNSH